MVKITFLSILIRQTEILSFLFNSILKITQKNLLSFDFLNEENHFIMKQASKRKFSSDEDAKLSHLVKILGTSNWIAIKRYFNNRTTRQLKERWRLYLDPKVKQEPFTNEEDELLIEKQKQFGNSWKTIQIEYFPNRTDISLRNRFVKLQKMNLTCDDLSPCFEDIFQFENEIFFPF
jgi:hypothetical protein